MPDLLLLSGATFLHRHTALLGNLVQLLSDARSIQILDSWSYSNPAAESLLRVGQILARSQTLQDLPAQPPDRGASRILRGSLDNAYVLGALINYLPGRSPGEDHSLHVLKLWLLAHAVERAGRGVLLDAQLKIACDALRLASERDAVRLDFFALLQPGGRSLESVNRAIRARIHRERAASRLPRRLWKLSELAAALERVARHEDNPIPSRGDWSALVPDLQSAWSVTTGTPAPADRAFVPSPADEETNETQLFPADEERAGASSLAGVPQEPDLPPSQSARLANAILLQSRAGLHHLPWSALRPSPLEIDAIRNWLAPATESEDPQERLVAALTWVALATGRSLHRTVAIGISATAGPDWTFHRQTFALVRIPARRKPGWQPATERELAWVTTPAPVFRLQLLEAVAATFRGCLAINPHASSFGALWNQDWGRSPEAALLDVLQRIAPRVTPGLLGESFPQQVFLQTGDAVLARLLSSHPQSGLPAAAAYPRWTCAQVAQHLQGSPESFESTSGSANCLGSLLDTVDTLLVAAVAQAGARLDALATSSSLRAFHNAFVAFHVVALWAGTGVRPLRDPFESIGQFDPDAGFVFVDDKHTAGARTGRLVPLVAAATEFLSTAYPAYLRQIASLLEAHDPALAAEIRLLADGRPTGRLPHFFLLGEAPGSTWQSVSPAAIERLGLFDWPLPQNLFRHRLATRLRERGLDPEIIDGLFGHAEAGTATYGDASFRVWHADMKLALAALEEVFRELGFGRLGRWQPHAGLVPDIAAHARSASGALFGAKAREERRKERRRALIGEAATTIRDFLEKKERELHELDASAVDELARKLLFNAAGMPDPGGPLRYAFLLRALERLWRKHGRRVRMKRRYVSLEADRSPFSADAPGATGALVRLRERLLHPLPNPNGGRERTADRATRAAFVLSVELGIADARLLKDVLLRRNIRLAALGEQCWLEHAPNLDADDPDAAVRCFPLNDRAALILDALLDAKGSQGLLEETVAPRWADLLAVLQEGEWLGPRPTLGALVAALCRVVDQANVISRPGVIAGYLAGRVESYGLRWRDRLRLARGRPAAIAPREPEANTGPDLHAGAASLRAPATFDDGVMQEHARSFFADLRAELAKEMPQGLSVSLSAEQRLTLKGRLDEVIARKGSRVGPAVRDLGRWISWLSANRHAKTLLAPNSLLRYLSALSPAFEDVGATLDLVALDEDAITEFYQSVIDARDLADEEYAYAALRWFHDWLKRSEPIEDPDWSEIHAASGPSVAPAFIVEEDYLRAVGDLLARKDSDPRERLGPALLVMLCHRFALRGADAYGLARSDCLVLRGLRGHRRARAPVAAAEAFAGGATHRPTDIPSAARGA